VKNSAQVAESMADIDIFTPRYEIYTAFAILLLPHCFCTKRLLLDQVWKSVDFQAILPLVEARVSA